MLIGARSIRSLTTALLLGLAAATGAAQDKANDPKGEVAAMLDTFHEAAAKADETTYFGLFAPEGVFLGTDGTERWTVDEFRRFAEPYFRRESAWIFIPKSRHVMIAPGGDTAWFDEVLESAHYGSCRGSGVVRRIDGTWRLCHYNLTIPVPNDLASALVAMIRNGPAPTTLYLVRHAEKAEDPGDGNPPLAPEGRERAARLVTVLGATNLQAVYATHLSRTQETVRPAAEAHGLDITVRPAATDAKILAREIVTAHRGKAVLVCGHSDTIPALAAALGIASPIDIGPKDHGDIFIVTLAATGTASLARVRY